MHIDNDIASQNNISNVTSFVHTTSKNRLHYIYIDTSNKAYIIKLCYNAIQYR